MLGNDIKITSSGSGSNPAFLNNQTQEFIAVAGDHKFTVTLYTVNASTVMVFVNGIRATSTEYAVAGQDITFIAAMLGGEIVQVTN